MDQVVKDGAKAAVSSKDAAARCGLVITMLPNSPHVKSVVLGAEGVLEGAAPGTILVDMSSIAPLASQEICRECEKKGVKMIDAPVSGGEPKAVDGTLSIMAGGDKDVFDQVYDVLMTMGASAVHCGDIGAGNTTKLANQVIVALNIAAVSEAFMLSTRAGVDDAAGKTDHGAVAYRCAERHTVDIAADDFAGVAMLAGGGDKGRLDEPRGRPRGKQRAVVIEIFTFD